MRSWLVVERYGLVFCWHDPERNAPDMELPEYPEWDDPQWIRWRVDHLGTLPTHPQEVVDNMSDIRHLTFLHGSGVRWYENEVDGHILHQRQGGRRSAPIPMRGSRRSRPSSVMWAQRSSRVDFL